MQKATSLIRTKLRLPITRPGLVSRPRLQEQSAQGLCGPLTRITAPAGFDKKTLVASWIAACKSPVAWLSLAKDDNQAERFLKYLVSALQEADGVIGNEAAQLVAAAQQAPPEAVLTSLINDLDSESVAVFEGRTEGWIAGLQMAALSMRDREDMLEFIAGFSGTNRYILDYLLEEVLASQSPEIQNFLGLTFSNQNLFNAAAAR